MVALSARRLVWSAIDLIMPTTASTFRAFSASSRTVVSVASAWVAMRLARSETLPTCPEISWIEAVICSEPAATEVARWRASSAERVRPSAERCISLTAAPTASTTCFTSAAIRTSAVTTAQVSIGPT